MIIKRETNDLQGSAKVFAHCLIDGSRFQVKQTPYAEGLIFPMVKILGPILGPFHFSSPFRAVGCLHNFFLTRWSQRGSESVRAGNFTAAGLAGLRAVGRSFTEWWHHDHGRNLGTI